jgi:hypothetical protein
MSDTPSPGREPVDLLRVQIVGEDWHYSIAADVFEDAGNWGFLLADVARQIAESLAEDGKGDRAAVLRAVRDAFAHDLADDPPGAGE